jgi:pentatricopeptide repeat protein
MPSVASVVSDDLYSQLDSKMPESSSLNKALHKKKRKVEKSDRVYQSDFVEIRTFVKNDPKCLTSKEALDVLRLCGSQMVDETKESRTANALSIWNMIEDAGVRLDTRHYNALLAAHLDNENDFSPAKFASWMESRGVEMDKDTYGCLIAGHCQNGDLEKATALLQVMKENEMPINRHVFHSLITGNCRTGDLDYAETVLEVMVESDIQPDSDTYIVYLTELIRSGRDWNEVQCKLKDARTRDKIYFSDSQLFKVVLALVRKSNVAAARQVLDMLPKEKGYLNAVRNVIPQIIFEGDTDFAMDVYGTFTMPSVGSGGEHHLVKSRDHGLFLFRALVAMEVPPNKMVDMLKASIEMNCNRELVNRVIWLCVEADKVGYAKEVARLVKLTFGSEILHDDMFEHYIRQTLKEIKDPYEVIGFLSKLNRADIFPSIKAMANDIVPKLLTAPEFSQVSMTSVLSQIKAALIVNHTRQTSWNYIANAGVRHLLNMETQEHLNQAIHFVLSESVDVTPAAWSSSLARAYLVTEDSSALTAMIFRSTIGVTDSQKQTTKGKYYQEGFRVLTRIPTLSHKYQPNKIADEVLKVALQALQEARIGVPKAICELVAERVDDTETKRILDLLGEMHEGMEEYWTKNRIHEHRKALGKVYRAKCGTARGTISMDKLNETRNEILRQSLKQMESMRTSSNFYDIRLSCQLAVVYAELGDGQKVQELVHEAKERGHLMSPIDVDKIVVKFLENQFLDHAIGFYRIIQETGSIVYPDTPLKVALSLLKEGKYEDMKLFLVDCKSQLVRTGDGELKVLSFMNQIKSKVAEEKNVERMRDLTEFLIAEKLLASNESHTYSGLVNVYLKMGDLAGAVDQFESIIEEHNVLPQKTYLMKALIEAEDMEKMQRVLDASMKVMGEEASLYLFALNLLQMKCFPQAINVLKSPGLRYNQHRAAQICNRLVQEGNLEALEVFVLSVENVYGSDREYLFSRLIESHLGDVDKLEKIVEMMRNRKVHLLKPSRARVAVAFRSAGMKPPFVESTSP